MTKKSPTQNPYIVGNPVEGDTLYGRDDVFNFVRGTLESSKQNAVVLFGQRRAGKTSILRELPNQLSKEKFCFTFFDLQGQATLELEEVLYKLAVEIVKPLNIPQPNQNDFIGNKDYFRKDFLPQVRKVLGNRRLLLLFDEFEVPGESEIKEIRDRAEHEFYPYMRDLMNREKDLSFVFVVGRRIDDLTHWVKRIFKEAQYKKIGLLEESEAIALIKDPVKEILMYQPQAIRSILDFTSGHPYFTQLICFELFNYAKKNQIDNISQKDVEAVIEPALESGELAFSWLWDAVSDSGRIYLATVAHVRGENKTANKTTIQEVLKRFRLRPGADWNSYPRELIEWDVLKDEDADVQFVVKLVELWVRKSHTPRDVKITLMNKGEAQFSEARKLSQAGNNDGAIKVLRDLLSTNPNHLGAQLTLAQILLNQDKLSEGVQAFEDAYWMDEDVAVDGLIDARLAMAQDLEKEGKYLEAAPHYRRVLELKPDEYRLQEKFDILYSQGRKAAASSDWENAASLFEQITNIDASYKDAKKRRKDAYAHISVAVAKSQNSRKPLISVFTITIIIALTVGGIVGGWFIWGEGQDTPTATSTPQAIAGDSTPTIESTKEASKEPSPTPTQEQTPTPTEEPSPAPTQEQTPTPTEEPSPAPTQEQTPTPTEELPPTPTATPIFIVVTSTLTPTPILPSYPQPQLITPPNLDLTTGEGHFTGKANQPILKWEMISGLGDNDFYTVSVSYRKGENQIFGGTNTKDTSWAVPSEFFDDVSGPQKDFEWFIVVSHFEDSKLNQQGTPIPDLEGDAVEVSPTSEVRTFRWD